MKQTIFTILLMLLPMVASADDTGSCGDNLTWTFESSTGTLSISGTGSMANYWSQEDTPWYSFKNNISRVIIENGVSSIGKCAFYGFSGLISMNIPNSVTDIGERAFQNCTGLISATIGSSVTKIRHNAFNGCSSLISVTIPNSVTSLGDYVFQYCSGLTSVTIGSGLTAVGQKAFFLCENLTSVHIADLASWCNISFYEQASNPLNYAHHLFLNNVELKDIIIPNSVTYIGQYTFSNCSGLISAVIPNNVTSISQYAFSGCSGLTSVSLPEGLTSISKYAFYGCSSLTSVSIPESVTSIGEYAFSGCSNITSINIPTGVTTINSGTFQGCSGLTSITIPEGVTTINGGAFNGSGLTSVSIPKSVTSIGDYVFSNCDDLILLEFHCKKIGASINRLTSLKEVIIGDEVTSIENNAFTLCSGLTSVTIGSGLTKIDYYAFNDCNSLTSIHISDLAAWCKITFVTNPLRLAHHLFLNDVEIKDLVIPESVTSISDNAFSGCSGFTSVTITKNVSVIGSSAFANCSNLTTVSINNGVISIGNYAFAWCSNLTSVNLSNSLQIIRESAFSDCSQLENIIIPASVEVIYQEAFKNCSSLTLINILRTTQPTLYDNSFSDFSVPVKVPKGCKEAYQNAPGWENFTNISDADKYKLLYVVDGEDYKSFDIEEGATIIPEAAPTKEGYTFSGWSEIPETMPAHDVTVIGSFSLTPTIATVTISSAEQGTYCFNEDLDFSDALGIKAYVACGFNPSNGNILLMRVKEVPAGTGLLVKGNAGSFTIPVKNTKFYYLNMLKPVFTTTTVNAEEDGNTNYVLANGSEGLKFYKSSGATLAANRAYLQIPTSLLGNHSNVRSLGNTKNDNKEGATATVTISSVGQSTFCYDQDLDFTNVSGVKAYVACGFDPSNGNILLMHVNEVPAGTGLLLKGSPGTYTIPVKDTQYYYLNMFKPVFAATTVATEEDGNTNYVLANGSEGLKFYKSSGASLAANRAYLQIPTSLLGNHSNARSIGYTFDDEEGTTAINSINENTDEGVLYNLNGQRVTTPRKGIYVRNGKKVFINK